MFCKIKLLENMQLGSSMSLAVELARTTRKLMFKSFNVQQVILAASDGTYRADARLKRRWRVAHFNTRDVRLCAFFTRP